MCGPDAPQTKFFKYGTCRADRREGKDDGHHEMQCPESGHANFNLHSAFGDF